MTVYRILWRDPARPSDGYYTDHDADTLPDAVWNVATSVTAGLGQGSPPPILVDLHQLASPGVTVPDPVP